MKTKYKIILGVWAAFIALFGLILPWNISGISDDPNNIGYPLILVAHRVGSTAVMDRIIFNLAIVTALAFIAHLIAWKFIKS